MITQGNKDHKKQGGWGNNLLLSPLIKTWSHLMASIVSGQWERTTIPTGPSLLLPEMHIDNIAKHKTSSEQEHPQLTNQASDKEDLQKTRRRKEL